MSLWARMQKSEAAPGLAMMFAAGLGFALANSPWADAYERALHLPLEIRLGEAALAKPLLLWINEGLMTLFFLLAGLEIKREVLEGVLASPKRAALPLAAAAGGMLVPAAVYLLVNLHAAGERAGWAIPMATDIAFALGAMALAGKAPRGLRAFLLTLAVVDDLGAVVVIALAYTPELAPMALAWAAGMLVALGLLAWRRVAAPAPYFVLGALLWLAVLKSGAHATLAGVLVAMFLPVRHAHELGRRIEHRLAPWVAFGVLPLFAFANAGVPLVGEEALQWRHPVPLGIALGLLVGKPLGVLLGAWLAVRLAGAHLPTGANWRMLAGVGMLAGIGFTMSLFIQGLAFENDLARGGADKLAVLASSLAAGALGIVWLRRAFASAKAAG